MVRNSDNSDEAAAFYSSQTRSARPTPAAEQARAALEHGARSAGTDKTPPLPRHQAFAALALADALLADLAPTREGAFRRARLEAVRGEIGRASRIADCPTRTLRTALIVAGKLLRDLTITRVTSQTCRRTGLPFRRRLWQARLAIDDALNRLPVGRAPARPP